MNRRDLIVLAILLVLVGAVNVVNYLRKQELKRNLALVIEEGIRPISINSSLASELQDIPGIGPALANRIVDYRMKNGDFKDLNELKKVKGIGDRLFKEIIAYVKL